MNPAVFSPCEATNLCNSLSFPTHVSSATSPLLQPVMGFAREIQHSKHRMASSKHRNFQRICFKAATEMAVGPNHFRTPPKVNILWPHSHSCSVSDCTCPSPRLCFNSGLLVCWFRTPESMNLSEGCNVRNFKKGKPTQFLYQD